MSDPPGHFVLFCKLQKGGHTSLFLIEEKFCYQLIGRTRDDPASEALNKIAKYLDLGHPGGSTIDTMAEKGDAKKFDFAFPRMTDQSMEFSFNGLKIAAFRRSNGITSLNHTPLFWIFGEFRKYRDQSFACKYQPGNRAFQAPFADSVWGDCQKQEIQDRFCLFCQEDSAPLFYPLLQNSAQITPL